MLAHRSDALVIGAGISGLVAASVLTSRGYKVTVLERDIHPGGCAASFSKEGYRFAVGATVAMGLEPEGLIRSLYNRLGLKPEYIAQEPAMRVHLEDRKLWLYTKPQDWLKEVERVFPGQTDKKLAFWQETSKFARVMYRASKRYPVLPLRRFGDIIDTLKAFHPEQLSLLPLFKQTVANRLERYQIKDTQHQTLIDGQLLDSMQTTSQHCVAMNGALALDIYRFGCQYKIGGLSSIAEDLVGYLKAKGSEVHYASRVKEIVTEKGRVTGLNCSRGEYEAPVIISAIPLSNTVELLDEPAKKLQRQEQKQAKMWGAFTLYLGVDEHCLPADAACFEQISDADIKAEAGNILVSTSPAEDTARAPRGKRAITMSTHVDADKWMNLAKGREAYAEAKRKMETKMIRQLERIFPDIQQGIEVCMSASPRTFKNFTLRHGGEVGGFPQMPEYSNFNAPSHHTDIQGLFLAGDTVFPGQGILGTSISGHNAARTASRFLKSNLKARQKLKAKHIISEEKKELVL